MLQIPALLSVYFGKPDFAHLKSLVCFFKPDKDTKKEGLQRQAERGRHQKPKTAKSFMVYN